jgi:2-oxoglutarate ferredoxin oxidoreductase subunit gamma
MIEKIIVAGAGGQGIMVLGKVLSQAAMLEGKFVTWLPSYGAEVRGGTAHCMVVISDEEIGSVYIAKADSLIVMNSPSLEKFEGRLKDNGSLIINSSLVMDCSRKDVFLLKYPFTDIAISLGNIRVANMVALGVFIAAKNIIGLEGAQKAILDIAPTEKKDLIEINRLALEKGFALYGKS